MKDSSGHEIVSNRKPFDMAQNRHYTTSGYTWGWIDDGINRYYWSNEPNSRFTEEMARKFKNDHNQSLISI